MSEEPRPRDRDTRRRDAGSEGRGGDGRERRDGPRGAGGRRSGYQGSRPSGSGGYQGNRSGGSGGSGGYQGSRPSGSGGYQGSRPSGSGGYQGSRPSGSGGYQGSRPSRYGSGRPDATAERGDRGFARNRDRDRDRDRSDDRYSSRPATGYSGGSRSGGTYQRSDRPRSGPPRSPDGSVWGGIARGGGGYRDRGSESRPSPARAWPASGAERGRPGFAARGRSAGGRSWRNDDPEGGSRRAGRPPALPASGDLSDGRSVSRAATAGRNLWNPSPRGGSAGARGPIIKRSPHSLGGEQVEGRQAVRELLAAGRRQVIEVWMTEGSDPSPILGEIDRLARDSHVPVRLVSQRRLESVQGTDAPQGVVAFAEPLTAANLDDLVLGWNEASDAAETDAGDESAPGVEDIEDIEDDFFIELSESALLDVDPGDEAEVSSLVELATESGEAAGESDDDESPGAIPRDATTLMPAADEAVVAEPEPRGPEPSPGPRPSTAEGAFLVLLEGVTDPQNLGAILRSAECAGVTGVAVPRHRSVHVTPAVTKAAAGAIEHLPMALVAGMPSALQELGRLGVMTVGLDERSTASLYDLDLASRPVALVLGSEGSGLSPLSRRRCDVLCKIPVGGEIPSLNVSAAAAVACFEVARQRNPAKRG